MKIIRLILLFFILPNITFAQEKAQDKGFTFLIGPSANVYYGDTKEKFSYTSDRLSFQVNGQLGYISTRGGTIHGNMIAIFGSAGNTNSGNLARMQTGNPNFQTTLDVTRKLNEFYTLEGGIVIAGFLRLSGGIGRQHFSSIVAGTDANGNKLNLTVDGKMNYFSGTMGFVFDLGSVNWVIDANLMAGKDLNMNIARFSTGFMVKF